MSFWKDAKLGNVPEITTQERKILRLLRKRSYIKSKQIMQLCDIGYGDYVRGSIAILRANGHMIIGDQKGYRLAVNKNEYQEYLLGLEARANSIKLTVDLARSYLQN